MREIKFRAWDKDNKKMLEVKSIHFMESDPCINVDENEVYMQEALNTGHKSMPIVVLNGRVVASGFQPDKLNELAL